MSAGGLLVEWHQLPTLWATVQPYERRHKFYILISTDFQTSCVLWGKIKLTRYLKFYFVCIKEGEIKIYAFLFVFFSYKT